MRRTAAFWKRLGGWWGREERERELGAELDAHFQLHVEDNLRAGMSDVEAMPDRASWEQPHGRRRSLSAESAKPLPSRDPMPHHPPQGRAP